MEYQNKNLLVNSETVIINCVDLSLYSMDTHKLFDQYLPATKLVSQIYPAPPNKQIKSNMQHNPTDSKPNAGTT
jgi:hypothetical protein